MTDAIDAELAAPREAHPHRDPRDEAKRWTVGSPIVGSPGPLIGIGSWTVGALRPIDRPPRVRAGRKAAVPPPPASGSDRVR